MPLKHGLTVDASAARWLLYLLASLPACAGDLPSHPGDESLSQDASIEVSSEILEADTANGDVRAQTKLDTRSERRGEPDPAPELTDAAGGVPRCKSPDLLLCEDFEG